MRPLWRKRRQRTPQSSLEPRYVEHGQGGGGRGWAGKGRRGHETPGRPGEGGVKSRKPFWKEVIQPCQHARQEAGWQEREPGLPGRVSVSPQGAGGAQPCRDKWANREDTVNPWLFPFHTATRRETENLDSVSNYWDSTGLFYAVTSIHTQYIKHKNAFTTTKHRTQKYTFGQIPQEHTHKESIRMGEFVCFNVAVILN